MFCLSLAATLRKIQDPQKKEYTKLHLQQSLYNCMYRPIANPQPTVPQPQPQVPFTHGRYTSSDI